MLKPYICTQCHKPYDPFEEWFYWPEDSGHEACLKAAEVKFGQWLQSEENMQYAESDGAPTTLEDSYAQEGGPPHKNYNDWREALNEIAYTQAAELIHELTEAAMEHMEPENWKSERPWVGRGLIARVVFDQFNNVALAEMHRSAHSEGENYANFLRELKER